MILQDDLWSYFDVIILIFILSSCLCAPIARAMQERRNQRANQLAHQRTQEQESQAPTYVGPSYVGPSETPSSEDKNLRLWEETLLNAQIQDRQLKLEAISKLGRLGTKATFDMLSEYAEQDRDAEILAAIENALEKIESRGFK